MRTIGEYLIVAALAVATPAQAASNIIVSCKWENGDTEVYKFSPNNWQIWDSRQWTWQPKSCTNLTGDAATCSVVIYDGDIFWTLHHSKSINDVVFDYQADLSINRLSGNMRFWSTNVIAWPHKLRHRDTVERAESLGACVGAADPSSSPKPAPPPPPKPKF